MIVLMKFVSNPYHAAILIELINKWEPITLNTGYLFKKFNNGDQCYILEATASIVFIDK